MRLPDVPGGGSGAVGRPARRYHAAHEWLLGMEELVRPGLTCGSWRPRATDPRSVLEQRYECMVHGIGLEEETRACAIPRSAAERRRP